MDAAACAFGYRAFSRGYGLMTDQPLELWAFLENSDFQRRKGGKIYRQDEVELIRHDEFLETDYRLLTEIGVIGVRDAARWYVTHPAPDRFDWSWLDRVVATAEKFNLRLYLDLWHYGYPDWLDLMSADAVTHFAAFARQIARRYPSLVYYCVSNEPSLLIERGGLLGTWRPFQRRKDTAVLRHQICRMIIEASRAILEVKPDAQLILPEPWFASDTVSLDDQAAVLDTVLGRRDPALGGESALVTVVGLNHYRDTTIPPFHRLLLEARRRWADKPIWLTETSGPPKGWKQEEWFWWMLAEVRLANHDGAGIPVFTWAPTISMYDWVDETLHLPNGVWVIAETESTPTTMRKIVVTDDRGRYLLPDLPPASYDVWVRGYGLVDSPRQQAEPGTTLNLNATPAPNPRAAAAYYPAGYWYSLMKVPAESEFPGTGLEGNGINPAFKSQAEYVRLVKGNGCFSCHQLGSKGTREVPPDLGTFQNSAQAWARRLSSGQAGGAMIGAAAAVLLRAPAEFRVGHDERRVPFVDFLQRRLEGNQTLGQFGEQTRMHVELIAVGIEAVVRDLDAPQGGVRGGAVRAGASAP